jgi:glycosyltransferase involved in cell wall biosynthesis
MEIRRRYNLPENALVCGCVGTLSWNKRQAYCYGLELVETLKKTTRTDVYALIVGDGSGRKILESRVPDSLKSRIIFTGKVPEKEVVCALNAMDIGFIAQTLDQLGSFRLTTKLPEYLACGLPVAMSPIVGFYDYVESAGWPLPAYHPADPEFHTRCAAWLDRLKMSEIIAKRSAARALAESRFAYKELGEKFRRFVSSLLEETGAHF